MLREINMGECTNAQRLVAGTLEEWNQPEVLVRWAERLQHDRF